MELLYSISYLFILFLFYSFIGYLCEVISVSLIDKKIVLGRGYLIGPIIPIFGFGSLIITYYLDRFKDDLITLFIMGMVLCCTLEYFTSFIMELIFKFRWWDYSDKKFNLNGRICLETGFLFGMGAIVIIRFINLILMFLIDLINNKLLIIISIILFILVLFDFIFSTYVVVRLNINSNKYFNISGDATKYIKDELNRYFDRYKLFNNRIFNAFPNIKNVDKFNILKKNR